MQVQDLTKKIYEEFPIVWGKLKDKYDDKSLDESDNFYYYCWKGHFNISYENDEFNIGTFVIPFSMLYGLLEDFFEENGIIITYYPEPIIYNLSSHHAKNIDYSIYIEREKDKYKFCYNSYLYYPKDEAKEQAILKACEILEDME